MCEAANAELARSGGCRSCQGRRGPQALAETFARAGLRSSWSSRGAGGHRRDISQRARPDRRQRLSGGWRAPVRARRRQCGRGGTPWRCCWRSATHISKPAPASRRCTRVLKGGLRCCDPWPAFGRSRQSDERPYGKQASDQAEPGRQESTGSGSPTASEDVPRRRAWLDGGPEGHYGSTSGRQPTSRCPIP